MQAVFAGVLLLLLLPSAIVIIWGVFLLRVLLFPLPAVFAELLFLLLLPSAIAIILGVFLLLLLLLLIFLMQAVFAEALLLMFPSAIAIIREIFLRMLQAVFAEVEVPSATVSLPMQPLQVPVAARMQEELWVVVVQLQIATPWFP
jgi:hypothetical protein